jgi:hypothetical protein
MRTLAILTSDIHLSHKAPTARAAEPNWYDAQARQLTELSALAIKHEAPVTIAGDLFDRWNSDEIYRSAYWTLVRAGRIRNLLPGQPMVINDELVAWGFPWGSPVEPVDMSFDRDKMLHLAVCHEYIWSKPENSYQGAPQDQKTNRFKNRLDGFHAAVFGDNHKRFQTTFGKPRYPLINCGTFFCRRQDERDYQPLVYLLKESGDIETHNLNVEKDLWSDPVETISKELDLQFLEDLKKIDSDSFDFEVCVSSYLESNSGISDMTIRTIRAILDEALEQRTD